MHGWLLAVGFLFMGCNSTSPDLHVLRPTGRVIAHIPQEPLVDAKLWTGAVFFHWYGMDDNGLPNGQFYSPWVALEGRDKWDGSVDFYARHTLLYSYAGFNMIPFQDVHDRVQDQRNHLTAIKELRDVDTRRSLMREMEAEYGIEVFRGAGAEDLAVPKVSPFIDQGSFPDASRVKDFTKTADKEEFYTHLSDLCRDVLDILGPEGFAWHQGRVLINIWYIPGAESAKRDFYPWINTKLQEEFGFKGYFSVHHAWKTAGADEFNYLFSGKTDLAEWNSQGNVDLLVGYWPPDNAPHSYWVPRAGGGTLRQGLQQVKERFEEPCVKAPRIVWVESYNEYTEGSGVYPARCAQMPADAYSGQPEREVCLDTPCIAKRHASWYDVWGDCGDPLAPFMYLDMLRAFNTEFQELAIRPDRTVCFGGLN